MSPKENYHHGCSGGNGPQRKEKAFMIPKRTCRPESNRINDPRTEAGLYAYRVKKTFMSKKKGFMSRIRTYHRIKNIKLQLKKSERISKELSMSNAELTKLIGAFVDTTEDRHKHQGSKKHRTPEEVKYQKKRQRVNYRIIVAKLAEKVKNVIEKSNWSHYFQEESIHEAREAIELIKSIEEQLHERVEDESNGKNESTNENARNEEGKRQPGWSINGIEFPDKCLNDIFRDEPYLQKELQKGTVKYERTMKHLARQTKKFDRIEMNRANRKARNNHGISKNGRIHKRDLKRRGFGRKDNVHKHCGLNNCSNDPPHLEEVDEGYWKWLQEPRSKKHDNEPAPKQFVDNSMPCHDSSECICMATTTTKIKTPSLKSMLHKMNEDESSDEDSKNDDDNGHALKTGYIFGKPTSLKQKESSPALVNTENEDGIVKEHEGQTDFNLDDIEPRTVSRSDVAHGNPSYNDGDDNWSDSSDSERSNNPVDFTALKIPDDGNISFDSKSSNQGKVIEVSGTISKSKSSENGHSNVHLNEEGSEDDNFSTETSIEFHNRSREVHSSMMKLLAQLKESIQHMEYEPLEEAREFAHEHSQAVNNTLNQFVNELTSKANEDVTTKFNKLMDISNDIVVKANTKRNATSSPQPLPHEIIDEKFRKSPSTNNNINRQDDNGGDDGGHDSDSSEDDNGSFDGNGGDGDGGDDGYDSGNDDPSGRSNNSSHSRPNTISIKEDHSNDPSSGDTYVPTTTPTKLTTSDKEKDKNRIDKLLKTLRSLSKLIIRKKFSMPANMSDRREYFDEFFENIKIVTDGLKETRNFTKDMESKTEEELENSLDADVDQAIYITLMSNCEKGALLILKRFPGKGLRALAELKNYCSQNTSRDRTRIKSELNKIEMNSRSESASNYLQRLRRKLDKAQRLGLDIDEDELVDQALNGFLSGTKYDSIVAGFIAQNDTAARFKTGHKVTFVQLEHHFNSFDEDLASRRRKQENANAISDKRGIKCNYCGKMGHTYNECRKRKADQAKGRSEEGRNNNSNSKNSNFVPTCYGCGQKGHIKPKCPNKHLWKNNEKKVQFESANVTKESKQEKINEVTEYINAAEATEEINEEEFINAATLESALATKERNNSSTPSHRGNRRSSPDDIRNYLLDSGASSHFTPYKSDLINPVEIDPIEVKLADGSIVESRLRGEIVLKFVSDEGKKSTLILRRVLLIEGLTQRLFSITAFVAGTEEFKVRFEIGKTIFELDVDTHLTVYRNNQHTSSNQINDIADDAKPIAKESETPSHTRNNSDEASQGSTNSIDRGPGQWENDDDSSEELVKVTKDLQPVSSEKVDKDLKKESKVRKVTRPLELTHNIFGHRSITGLIAGSINDVWADTKLTPQNDHWCESCKISGIRVANRSKIPMQHATKAFEKIYMDLIPMTSENLHSGLTPDTTYPCYLFIVDEFSKAPFYEPMEGHDTDSLIETLTEWISRMQANNAMTNLEYIRSDAGTVFKSHKFRSWCSEYNVSISLAAAKHQEQNSIAERAWGTVNDMARSMLVHASLSLHFKHLAIAYACACLLVLPAKGLRDDEGKLTTPYFKIYGRKPRISQFHVFGCPTIFKRYAPSYGKKVITKKKQIQRGSRGIFVGFPIVQAGYLLYIDEAIKGEHLVTSLDVLFDDKFLSPTVASGREFHSGKAIREVGNGYVPPIEHTEREHTGNINDYGVYNETIPDIDTYNSIDSTVSTSEDVSTEEGKDDFDYSDLPPLGENSNAENKNEDEPEDEDEDEDDDEDYSDMPALNDNDDSDDEDSDDEDDEDEDDVDIPLASILRRGTRIRRPPKRYVESIDTALEVEEECKEIYEAIATAAEADQIPINDYLPEPQNKRALLNSSPKVQRQWLSTIKKEIVNLLDNKTFNINESPNDDDEIIPSMLVLKAKIASDGFLDKLKARLVARGDQQQLKPAEETWSGCVHQRTVKAFIARSIPFKRRIKQLDFIGAFLQARMKHRLFIRLPQEYAEFFPEYKKYFDKPLLLIKSIYGTTFAAKSWHDDLAEWLTEEFGFKRSEADHCLYAWHDKDGNWVRIIIYVDDALYIGNSDKTEEMFLTRLSERFAVEDQGVAHWFLNMRIQQIKDGSYLLDQNLYVQHLFRKYCPDDCSWGVPEFKDTPAPVDYVYTKENRPDAKEKAEIAKKYPDLKLSSICCSLLYLAMGTRSDILWLVCKIAKACSDPSMKDYDAAFHCLGYLRKYAEYGIKYYANYEESPVYQICKKHGINPTDLAGFSDSTFQDCPDTGRSTTGYKSFYRGGLIEANSSVPVPVALSTAEAEYMGACNLAVSLQHFNELLYDIEFLGTDEYSIDGRVPEVPVLIMVDNSAAVTMSKSYKTSKGNRHIKRRWHFVRQGSKEGWHVVEWIPGDDMLADDCTKTQPAKTSLSHMQRTLVHIPFKDTSTGKGRRQK